MSTFHNGLPFPSARNPIAIPVGATALLLVNGAGIWLGIGNKYGVPSSVATGIVDGFFISAAAVLLFSQRLQGCGTGLLGSLSLDKLTNDGNFLEKFANAIHHVVDTVLPPFLGTEDTHRLIEDAVLRITWVAGAVVLVSLLGTWILENPALAEPLKARRKAAAGR